MNSNAEQHQPQDQNANPQTESDVEDPPVLDPVEPEPEPTPPPPAPVTPGPLTWEPATYYSVTWACTTPGCPNHNVVLTDPLLYSNAGVNVRINCGQCSKDGKILTATKLDPQPEVS